MHLTKCWQCLREQKRNAFVNDNSIKKLSRVKSTHAVIWVSFEPEKLAQFALSKEKNCLQFRNNLSSAILMNKSRLIFFFRHLWNGKSTGISDCERHCQHNNSRLAIFIKPFRFSHSDIASLNMRSLIKKIMENDVLLVYETRRVSSNCTWIVLYRY